MTVFVAGILFAEFAVAAFFAVVAWRQEGQLAELRSRHAKPRADAAAASVRPATTLVTPADGTPVWHEETPAAAHANAMWNASEPYLPPPVGRHAQAFPRYSNSRADLPVQPVETGDAPPWDISTAQQDAVPDDVQAMRREYIASQFRQRERAGLRITTGFMRETVKESQELPVYGEKPVADVLESERLNQVMMP